MQIRVGWLLAGLVLAIPGVWLASGTFPVLANGGFPMSAPQRFETSTRALVFEDAEERAYDADTWSEGNASSGFRVEARSVDGSALFVGIARADRLLGLRRARPPTETSHRARIAFLAGIWRASRTNS
jgi:hypothetical protein